MEVGLLVPYTMLFTDHNIMKLVTVRYSLFSYSFFIAIALLLLFGISIDYRHFIETGTFKKGLETFVGLAAVLLGIIFILSKVLPSYKVLLSNTGIIREYTVRLGNFVFYRDKYGQARWEDVESLDTFNIGWLWGLALFFRIDGHQRMVLLNVFFSNKKNALRMIVENIPSRKITKEAMKKMRKLGIEVDK